MIIGIKDGMKLVGISIMACCAVFVCTLFMNYNMDLVSIEEQMTSPQMMIMYDALVSMGKVVSGVSGGCLLITSGIMLVFYIKNYIDTHKKELGILKALGYSNFKIAKNFWVFAISVLIGTGLGFGGAWLIMSKFYEEQNADKMLPEFEAAFHLELVIGLMLIPTIAFGVLAILYACVQLKQPTIDLLKEKRQYGKSRIKGNDKKSQRTKRAVGADREEKDVPFLKEMQKATIRSRKSLLFFVVFGAFCFSSMMQMSAGMNEIASEMMAMMIFIIGAVLACVTLVLAVTTVVKGNTKSVSMMRVFGYTFEDCKKAVLDGYRPWAYLGFVIGSGYQYGLIKMVVEIVFKDIENVPDYEFDVQIFMIVLIVFVILYEAMMFWYSNRMKKISVKEVMME